ncbi:hypothetical protein [Zavarzinia sp. CC-PAN008]|uniref:hypothetical protein n=1 Tax=Zavarzinia sp. CC-PAN008 TaxID=3243332 RepID=UPI003F748D59
MGRLGALLGDGAYGPADLPRARDLLERAAAASEQQLYRLRDFLVEHPDMQRSPQQLADLARLMILNSSGDGPDDRYDPVAEGF